MQLDHYFLLRLIVTMQHSWVSNVRHRFEISYISQPIFIASFKCYMHMPGIYRQQLMGVILMSSPEWYVNARTWFTYDGSFISYFGQVYVQKETPRNVHLKAAEIIPMVERKYCVEYANLKLRHWTWLDMLYWWNRCYNLSTSTYLFSSRSRIWQPTNRTTP